MRSQRQCSRGKDLWWSKDILKKHIAARRRTSMWSGGQNESSGVLGRVQNALIRSIYQISHPTFWDFVLNKIFFTKQDPGPRSYPRVSFPSEPKSSTDMVFSPLPYQRHLFVVWQSPKMDPNQLLLLWFVILKFRVYFCVNDRGAGSFQLVQIFCINFVAS